MDLAACEPDDPASVDCDVLVVGTGMGGATTGYALARRGHRVLFLEKGRFLQVDPDVDRELDPGAPVDDLPEARLRRGRWPYPLEGSTTFGELEFFAPLGCGTGGSTALYAAALERFSPADFRPAANFPDEAESSLPQAWPIDYDDLVPYYREAEALYRVRGTADPLGDPDVSCLREPPPLSPRDEALFRSFREGGLHPYRLHVGLDFVEGCRECPTGPCFRNCKSDAARICLVPAIERHGARLLTRCEVLRLEARSSRVTRVHCRWRGGEIAIDVQGIVVLAAGALMSPVVLLRSQSAEWPDGLANRSGLVGRNLMFHATELVAVRPNRRLPADGPKKTLAANDFYVLEGKKLGTFQSLGSISLDAGMILGHLRTLADQNPSWWRGAGRPFYRVAAHAAARYLRGAAIFAAILEDLPYEWNRVVHAPGSVNEMKFEYRYADELRERTALLRRELAQALRRQRTVFLTGKNNLNFGHGCGTCRFGYDPGRSVLDRNNRAHDVENLYVVDASFFPSSGGANPSLTIAANALRVAEQIHLALAESGTEHAGATRPRTTAGV